MDPDDIARRFRPEVKQAAKKPELAFPAPVPERGVPAGAVVLLGATLAVGAYIGWYQASGEKPGAEPVRPVPVRLAELAVPPPATPPQPAPVAGQVPAASIAPAPGASSAAPAALPPQAALAPFPVVPPSSAAAAVVPGAVPPAPPPSAAGALPDGTRIVLRARAEAWIQVRDRQGQVLLNRVLRQGETWPVPPRLSLLLTTGNAGGTELLVDGTPAAPLGADGAVRRDLPLDADAIRDGRLATPAAASARPAGRAP
jgi:cytoskeleton protein RodZ